jgi:oxygen-independent coproporphyrinogen-3 oxidase
VALYIHFPFCVSVCPYCDFVVYGGRAARGPENRVAALVDALVTEIELRGRAARLGSVYIGGGTPSLMSAQQVARLLEAADTAFGISADAEVTLEVNPGTADRGDMRGFAAAGINRVSIGAQSMSAPELKTLGRRHAADEVVKTVAEARAAGIASVSVDLLYDVPGQTLASWRDTLDVTLALEPDHVSGYALTLDVQEPSEDHLVPTRGAAAWRARARTVQDEDRAAQMYEVLDERLSRAGLTWYEISNWSRPGHESRHNELYWLGGAWEAVGPGAHAFDGAATRRWNSANLEHYVAALAAKQLPPGNSTTTDNSESVALGTILRLRTAAGVSPDELGAQLPWAMGNRLVERAIDGRIRLTVRGRLLSNELFSRIMPDSASAAA